MPLQEQPASANDDLVRVVGVLFIADVVEPTDGPAIVCNDLVASGGREQASKLRLPPQALRCTLIADPLTHGGSVIRSLASQAARRGAWRELVAAESRCGRSATGWAVETRRGCSAAGLFRSGTRRRLWNGTWSGCDASESLDRSRRSCGSDPAGGGVVAHSGPAEVHIRQAGVPPGRRCRQRATNG